MSRQFVTRLQSDQHLWLGLCCYMIAMQVLQAVVERVQDFEEKVRSKAIGAICEAAVAHPEVCSTCAWYYRQHQKIKSPAPSGPNAWGPEVAMRGIAMASQTM